MPLEPNAVPESRRAPAAETLCLAAILLLAAGLRFYRIDAQSLWYDEGNSARIAERSIQLILEGAAGDIHPPLYYLALSLWRGLFGASETALRSLSAACGIGIVGLAWLLGRRLFSRRIGLAAAALVAISPFAIYYSQEARMYAMLALWAALSSVWIATLATRGSAGAPTRARRLAGPVVYALATAAGLYTHYAYPFVMIAQAVALGLAGLTDREAQIRQPRALLAWALANLAAITLFGPWLPIALRQIQGWTVAPQAYALGPAILDALRWVAAGRTLPTADAALPLVALGALSALGLAAAPAEARRRALLPLALALVPFALLFVFKLYRESYLKFLLVCVLPLALLAARGLPTLAARIGIRSDVLRWTRPAALAGAVILASATLAGSLNNLYNNPAYARDDYRGIARRVLADVRPGDRVWFSGPNQWEVYTYYDPEPARSFPVPYLAADDTVADTALSRASAGADRIYVLYYGEREADPESRYERWLAGHAHKAGEEWIGNIRFAEYRINPPLAPVSATGVWAGAIALSGARA
ncbi:MAG: glycosyltransferase family 39 protein, partial [Thermoflexales bacterium]